MVFAFAKDLNISPAVLSFLVPDFESDFLRVLALGTGCGVDRSGVLSPDAFLPSAGADVSFSLVCATIMGFDRGLAAGLGAAFEGRAAAGGAYLAVLRCIDVSLVFGSQDQEVYTIP